MAKLPGGMFRGPLSERVPMVSAENPSEASITARSLRAVGEGLQDLGVNINRFQERQEIETARHFMYSEKANFTLDLAQSDRDKQQQIRELPLDQQEQAYKSYMTERESLINERQKQVLETAPNKYAKDEVKNLYTNALVEHGTSFAFRIEDQVTNTRKNLDNLNTTKLAKAAYDLKDLTQAEENFVEASTYYQNSDLYGEVETYNKIQESKAIITATLDGMLEAGGSKLIEGESFLNGKSKHKRALAGLDQRTIDGYKKRFEARKEEEFRERVSEKLVEVNNLAAVIKDGGGNELSIKKLNSEIENLKLLKETNTIKNPSLDNAISKLQTQAELVKDDIEMRGISLSDLNKRATDINSVQVTDDASFDSKQARIKNLQQYYTKMVKDPVAVVMKENPNIPEGTEAMFAKIEERGFQGKYYSEKTGATIINGILNSPDKTETLHGFLSNPQLGDVKAKKEFLKQQGHKNEAVAEIAVAAMVDDKLFTKAFMSMNTQQAKQLNESFKREVGIADEDILRKLTKEDSFKEMLNSFPGAKNAAFRNVMTNKAILRVKEIWGKQSAGATYEQAVKDIVDNAVGTVELGSGRKLPVFGEFKAEDKRNIIQSNIDNIKMDGNFLNSVGVTVDLLPKNYREKYGISTIDQVAERFQLSDPQIEFSSQGNGVTVTYVNPLNNFQRQPLYVEKTNLKGEKFRTQLFIPYSDLADPSFKFKTPLQPIRQVSGSSKL